MLQYYPHYLLGDEGAELLAKTIRNSKIEVFSIYDFNITEYGMEYLIKAIEANRHIKAFYINCSMTDENAFSLSNVIKSHNSLCSIVIDDFNKITEKGLLKIGNAIHSNINIRSFYFHYNEIGYESHVNLMNNLSNKLEFKTLQIACDLSNKILNPILALNLKHNLSALFLEGQNIDDDGVLELSNGIANCQSLKTLYFSSNRITDDKGARYLAEAVLDNCSITSFGICSDNIYDDSIWPQFIESCDHVKTLYFYFNKITDENAKNILEALNFNNSLISLYLASDKFTENTFKEFFSKPTSYGNRSLLDLIFFVVPQQPQNSKISFQKM